MGVAGWHAEKHRVHLGQDDEDGGNSHGNDDRAGEGIEGEMFTRTNASITLFLYFFSNLGTKFYRTS